MHDVLKSWAVPKGMPLEPGVRRLAAATEDHPLEYLEFEGTIPKGEYGGGAMMVWDLGVWELIEGNYYKGRLHFHLDGTKLKGEWVLERDRGEEKKWRLIRLGDAIAEPDDLSAITRRTLDEIASGRERADLDGLPDADLDFIEPMQALAAAELPEGEQWLYEVKFDGYRTLAIRDTEGVSLLSRRNNLMNDRFPSIAAALAAAPEGSIFDGEVIALDAEGRPSFHVLQNHLSLRTPLLYYVFDLLAWRGRSLTKLTVSERRRLLETEALTFLKNPILLSAHLQATPQRLLEAARQQGLEGIVAKHRDSIYEPGRRTGSWVKVRARKGQELVIGGYKPGANGFDYLLIGYYKGDQLVFVAKLKNGFNPAIKRDIAARFSELRTDTCPFDNLPEAKNARRGEAITAEVMKSIHWLRPELVAQVDFVDWTEADHLRHASFVALRDDKDPRTVHKES
jgi:bifunctional non-homologous end joining protein LigD